MNLGRLSVNQPILAMVLSIVLLIVGAIAYTTLPVAEYPQVVPPTVVVTTQYPGASAQTVSDTVAAPIEQEINGVEDMLYLYSQATSNGQLTITVTFKLGTDLDKAQVLVQNRVAIAQPRLPEEVQRGGVVTRKNSPDILMVVFMLSPDDTFDQLYIRKNEGLPAAARWLCECITIVLDNSDFLTRLGTDHIWGLRDEVPRQPLPSIRMLRVQGRWD